MRPHPTLVTLALLTACGRGPVPQPALPGDFDGDGLLDVHEGGADPDADGLPNDQDLDSDGDGLLDAWESGDDDPLTFPVDSDDDGTPDFLDLDSDNNKEPDATEHDGRGLPPDTDGDGIRDPWDLDDDNDGVTDLEENFPNGVQRDTDKDAVIDRRDDDSDDDGASDLDEGREYPWLPLRDTDGDGTPDLRDTDSDGDGLDDALEVGDGPEPRDTDGDGTPDLRDTDSDNDGIPDADEVRKGTHPYKRDSDGDGFPDGVELTLGTDPGKPSSSLPFPVVELAGRDAASVTFDLVAGERRVDVALVVMPGYPDYCVECQDYFDFISSIPSQLKGVLPDAAIGVGNLNGMQVFYEYADAGPPLLVSLPMTDDNEALRTFRNSVFKGRVGTYDAHAQAVAGYGFDANCDGLYDPEDDVLPFHPSPDDPFGGAAGGRYDGNTTGTLGGMGFRPYSLRYLVDVGVVVYDHQDLSLAPEMRKIAYGCPRSVGSTTLVDLLAEHQVHYVGVNQLGAVGPPRHAAVDQMRRLATKVNNYTDAAGNHPIEGITIETMYYQDPSTLEPTLQALADLVASHVNQAVYTTVEPLVESDPYGFVTGISPASVPYTATEDPQPVSITVELAGVVAPTAADRVYRVGIVLAGDGKVGVDSTQILVIVPGDGRGE